MFIVIPQATTENIQRDIVKKKKKERKQNKTLI